jgi:hypothetical protein
MFRREPLSSDSPDVARSCVKTRKLYAMRFSPWRLCAPFYRPMPPMMHDSRDVSRRSFLLTLLPENRHGSISGTAAIVYAIRISLLVVVIV